MRLYSRGGEVPPNSPSACSSKVNFFIHCGSVIDKLGACSDESNKRTILSFNAVYVHLSFKSEQQEKRNKEKLKNQAQTL